MSTEFTITGNLAADPELRYTPTRKAIAKFTVISNQRHRDPQTGQWVDGRRTDVRVTAWDTLAENTAESLSKGTQVTVTGRRIEAHAFTSQHDDSVHASLELTADEVTIGLRWHTVTATKTTRTTGSGDTEAGQLSRGTEAPWAEPETVQDPAELQARVDLLRGHLGTEWVGTEGSAAGPEGGGS
ncbi:MAG TPA: single-stranded DNA-binding protein [Mycobacteriales bacterium]|jgi:single-strand DNA-binding protein|nr:single-stranded DNA-binding protein [Mycobacteriales bacterium]